MNRTVLQIPVNSVLREDAEKAAVKLGFSSLQDIIRLFMSKLAQGKIDVSIRDEKIEYLSPKAEKRYEKMIRDIKSGKEKLYKAESVDDLMRQLNS